MKMGFVDCITKPLDKEKVYEVLDAVLLKFINKCSKFNLHKQFALLFYLIVLFHQFFKIRFASFLFMFFH
jgi:hypothetical protein